MNVIARLEPEKSCTLLDLVQIIETLKFAVDNIFLILVNIPVKVCRHKPKV
jgi:hypothetical protein